MRKICARKTLLIILVFIISIITFRLIEEIFIVHRLPTASDCPTFPQDSIYSSSKHRSYLLIPYRQFVLRTPITCSLFKLDNQIKNVTNLYPRYSSFLRGRFLPILPHSNITYDEIEYFYTTVLPTSNNQTNIEPTIFTSNVTLESIPYSYEDGMWYPIGVRSAQRTAIIIPLLGRDYNAKTFILNMHAFARRQLLTYNIFLTEQVSPQTNSFNKGRLFNAAIRYIEKQKSLNITCLVLHDVDLIPEHDGNFYSCESRHPKHTTIRIRPIALEGRYRRHYEFLIGGVLLLTMDMYKAINGFSNLFWGWGGEDDDLSLRLIKHQICVVRPSYDVAIYAALAHPYNRPNDKRFNLLTWSIPRADNDGYRQIDSMIQIIDVTEKLTVTHLKINVDIKQQAFNVSNSTRFESPSNELSKNSKAKSVESGSNSRH